MPSTAPPGLPSRGYARAYVHDQLPGHNPNTPWWATPLGVLAAIAIVVVVLAILFWL